MAIFSTLATDRGNDLPTTAKDMKFVIKLEELGLFCLFTAAYFYHLEGTWSIFLGFFFVPDAAFVTAATLREVLIECYGVTNMAPMVVRIIMTDAVPNVNITSSSISLGGRKGQN